MPHFCHIMTNNILHETSFSITLRHTFLFLMYHTYNKHITTIKQPQPFKRFPKKVQWGMLRQTVMDRKITSLRERFSLCWSGIPVDFFLSAS